ncbi:EB domain-containing julius seizure protein isoform X2 [Musca autumnalis]|uniref:EB domain-containing julius seizure protein isoform X2 n=1 Tax=Musca autumnalis TaxID=221902 RepID=UPI003CFABD8B
MKFNGALKPRQGASIGGSSPGAVQLRRYRDKQYPNDISDNAHIVCLSEQQKLCPHHHLHHFYSTESGVSSKQINTTSISSKENRFKQLHLEGKQQEQQHHHSSNIDEAILGSHAARMKLEIINQPIATPSAKADEITSLMDCGSCGTIAWRQTSGDTGGGGSHGIDAVIIQNQKQQLNITTRQKKQQQQHGNKNDDFNQTNNSPNNESIKRPKAIATKLPMPNNKLNVCSNLLEIFNWCALPLPSVIFSRLFEQIALLLFWLALLMPSTGNSVCGNGGGIWNRRSIFRVTNYNRIAKIMRTSQSFMAILKRICFKNGFQSRLPLTTTTITTATKTCSKRSVLTYLLLYGAVAAIMLPQQVMADEGDNFFSPNGIVIGETTTEFDYASRGQKKFGDKCDNTLECGFPGSICDTKKKSCQCTEDLPVTNHFDKCGKEAAVNESCFFNEQCEVKYFQTECRDGRCVCRFDMTPIWLKDGSVECKGRQDKKGPETYIDPAMIGVLVGMALMFIIICVVLRLFSQARWRENRTIFNTPNPRLMNVSLLRESKLLHGQERRGSRMSVRAPSRQPSMASLRPHSPNPSLGSRSNSHGSNASATSLRSTRSNSVSPAINNAHHERKGTTYHPHLPHHSQHLSTPDAAHQQQHQPLVQQTNITANPVAESVTVDIIEPEK